MDFGFNSFYLLYRATILLLFCCWFVVNGHILFQEDLLEIGKRSDSGILLLSMEGDFFWHALTLATLADIQKLTNEKPPAGVRLR